MLTVRSALLQRPMTWQRIGRHRSHRDGMEACSDGDSEGRRDGADRGERGRGVAPVAHRPDSLFELLLPEPRLRTRGVRGLGDHGAVPRRPRPRGRR